MDELMMVDAINDGKLNAECGMRVGTARCPREHQHAREMPIRDDPARGNYK